MASHVPWSAVINLSNSIIGVSILAMPWCFRECGVIFGIALLALGGFLTKFTCYMLLRASKVSRKHSYEFLANHALGAAGKMAVELCIIGLLVCTCIAFFVIIGDLAPSIVSKWLGLQNSWHLRTCLLVLVAVFIVLPLGMKRNVESLGGLSMMSITFYLLFTADIVVNSIPHLLAGQWMYDINLWRLPGMLKGISIFSMSMCCQTTLFVVYDSLKEKTVKQMEAVVSKSLNMVGCIYTTVGFFGYVCYYKHPSGVKGDVLLNFQPSLLSEILRLGFTVSVALSFPLCIFPCRASIYTLFCHPGQSVENPHGGADFIPPAKFKVITLMIVSVTLMIGITIPDVEIILGLTGATMGSLIGFIIPAIIYLRTTGLPNKNNAKIVLVIGVLLLVCSTYDNLSTTTATEVKLPVDVDKIGNADHVVPDIVGVVDGKNLDVKVDGGDDVIKDGEKAANQKPDEKQNDEKNDDKNKVEEKEVKEDDSKDGKVVKDQRQEPPIPHAPDSKEVDGGKGEKSKEKADGDKLLVVKIADSKDEAEGKRDIKKQIKDEVKDAPEDEEDIGAADFDGDTEKKEDMVKKAKILEAENEKKKQELVEKEEQLKAKEEKIEKIVEVKVAEQEQKQEEQKKKLEELEIRQHAQEKIIEAQAEAIENLKVQHGDEKEAIDPIVDALEVLDNLPNNGGLIFDQLAGGQLAGGQLAGGNMQQPLVGGQQQMPVQAIQQQQQQQQFAPIQQQGGQPLLNLQPQDVAGKPVFQQGGAPQQGILQQDVPLQQGMLQQQGIPNQGVPLQQRIPHQEMPLQQGIHQQGVPLPQGKEIGPGIVPQQGLDLQHGNAPQPDVPHVVRREAQLDPQLQQQLGANVGQMQFQQQRQDPNQQVHQLNIPGQKVGGDVLMMQGAVAQQRQLLQGDLQSVLLNDQGKSNGANLSQDLQALEIDQPVKVHVLDNDEEVKNDDRNEEENNEDRQDPVEQHAQDTKLDNEVQGNGQDLSQDHDKDEALLLQDGNEYPQQVNGEGKDKEAYPNDSNDKEDAEKRSNEKVVRIEAIEENEKHINDEEELNIHSVKFKTRQEMAIASSTNPTKLANQLEHNSDSLSTKSDGSVHLPRNLDVDVSNQVKPKAETLEYSEDKVENGIPYFEKTLHEFLNKR